ncbi:MAG: nucleotide sugar dehydrogenase [Candidatus Bathyarchaeota archaeon]|nr:nucleotide sugar dehydrogenase [Candidatus Bathyarchaeota archaeon]
MPNVLRLNPQDVDSPQKRANYTVGIIGCGHKGIFYANAFAQAGFQVICTDADPSVTKKVTRGKTTRSEPQAEAELKCHITAGQISVSGDRKKAVTQSDIIIIAVGTKVDEKKQTDGSQILSACKQVGAALKSGVLVIYGGIGGFGFFEGILKETLQNTSGLKVGVDFGLAYNPLFAKENTTVTAGDKTSLEAATTILKTIAKNLTQIQDVKTAEIATLFAITKRDVNRALANELAVFCEQANLDYYKTAKTLGFNEAEFYPAIVEEEGGDESYLLLDVAENLNVKLRLPTLARQINEDMVKHALNLTQDALRRGEKTLRRSRIAVLGLGTQESEGQLVRMLTAKGAKVNVFDPNAKKKPQNVTAAKANLNDALEGADCIILLSRQDQVGNLNLKKIKALMKSPPVIVDLAGKFEPQEVETEGFIYRGLGKETR